MTIAGWAQLDLAAMATSFILVLVRVGALLMATPVFRSTGLPRRVRLMLAVALSVLALMHLPSNRDIPELSLALVPQIASELALGIAMGFLVQLMFASIAIAGESVAMGMGLGFANMVDPQNGTSVPTVSQHFVLTASLLFIVMNGHLWMLRTLFTSFAILPPGSQPFHLNGIPLLLDWAMAMYSNALFIALPVLIAMLLTNLAFGIVTRAAPQLNVFAIGFPMMLMIGFAILMIHVDHLIAGTAQLLGETFTQIERLLQPR